MGHDEPSAGEDFCGGKGVGEEALCIGHPGCQIVSYSFRSLVQRGLTGGVASEVSRG